MGGENGANEFGSRGSEAGGGKGEPFIDADKVARFADSLGHPLRVKILMALTKFGPIAPVELFRVHHLETLANVSYHVRKLVDSGAVEIIGTEPTRGTIKHNYGVTEFGEEVFAVVSMIGPVINPNKYDDEVDIATFNVRPGQAKSIQRTEWGAVFVDYDGEVVMYELQKASEHLPKTFLSRMPDAGKEFERLEARIREQGAADATE